MRELRSGVRRGGRAPPPPPVDRTLRNTRARAASKKPEVEAVAAGGSRRVRTRAAEARTAVAAEGRQRARSAKGKLVLIEEGGGKKSDQLKEVVVVEEEEEEEEEEEKGKGRTKQPEEIRGKEMMGDDSGGLSANRVVGQEEEGNTTPFPEKVQIGNSPVYKVERKLGKGGFGQVFVGRRVSGGIERTTGPSALEVGQKRGRLTIDEEEESQQRKKIRLGVPATQWISVYNARLPMKQRYHYNVADARLAQHVERGNEDGTQYTQQSYKVSESFPFKWINKKWKEGFHVTSMATAGTRWGIVMSRNAGFSDQRLDLFALLSHRARREKTWLSPFGARDLHLPPRKISAPRRRRRRRLGLWAGRGGVFRYADSLVVVGISVCTAFLCEAISCLLIYRTSTCKSLRSSIDKASKKLDSMKSTSAPSSSSVSSSSSRAKKMDRVETSLKDATRDLSHSKFKSGAVVAAVLFVVFGLLNSLFEGRVVAKLPFAPIPLVLKMSHRGLPGTDPTDCSMVFLYFLCSISIRTNLHKFLGFAPPERRRRGWALPDARSQDQLIA
ncbi:hypothetical protein C4D60_Mb06t12110 [Musa balbisiana]|uniref:DUF7477 domain-containing protein n=1 Tax=Musa balbisiana TaxID=52838 RepID=A0A4S8IPX4_MUSBA|nr:hypothetical protein C4D60_Mb06t12110 [Musa balbisiana]